MKRPRLISPHFGGFLFGIAYQNADKTIPHQNPIRLNAKGAVLLYGADIQEVRDINNQIVNLPLDDGYCYFVDKYGKPLANGKVYTYFYQSTVLKESFDNNGGLNTNPIILDDDGKAQINMDGNYRLRIYDKDGVCMSDDDDITKNVSITPIIIDDGNFIPPAPTDTYHAYAYNRLTLDKAKSDCDYGLVGQVVSYTHDKTYYASSDVSQDDAQAQADALAQADWVAFEAEAHTLAQDNANNVGVCQRPVANQDKALILFANFGAIDNALMYVANTRDKAYFDTVIGLYKDIPSLTVNYDTDNKNVLRDNKYPRDGIAKTTGSGTMRLFNKNNGSVVIDFPYNNMLDKLFYKELNHNGSIKDIIAYDLKSFVKKALQSFNLLVDDLRAYLSDDLDRLNLSSRGNVRDVRFVDVGWDINFYLDASSFNKEITVPNKISNYEIVGTPTLNPRVFENMYRINSIDGVDFDKYALEFLFGNATSSTGNVYVSDDDRRAMFDKGEYRLTKTTSEYHSLDELLINGINGYFIAVLNLKLLYDYQFEYTYRIDGDDNTHTDWANGVTSVDFASLLIDGKELIYTYLNDKAINIFNLE